jgi:Thiolase, N-terminal domain
VDQDDRGRTAPTVLANLQIAPGQVYHAPAIRIRRLRVSVRDDRVDDEQDHEHGDDRADDLPSTPHTRETYPVQTATARGGGVPFRGRSRIRFRAHRRLEDFVTEVVITSAARTAVGRYGGSLRDQPPTDLGALATKTALERSAIVPERVDQVCSAT